MNKIKLVLKILTISLIAFLPVAETKVALVYGTFYNIPWYINFLFSFLGNISIIPAYFFIKSNFTNYNFKNNFFTLHIYNFFLQYKKKLANKINSAKKFSMLLLIIIIAVPISGFGTWSGIIIGELLNMNKKEITLSICVGTAISIFISTLFIYGLLSFKIFNFRSFL